MKKILFILCFLTSISSAFAQKISKKVIENYSADVVVQVYDIVSKTDLEEEKQMSIAALIAERNKTIYEKIKSSEPQSDVLEAKNGYEDQINNVLDLGEKYDKYVATVKQGAKDKYSYSQFAIALRYKDSLSLSSDQYNTMLGFVDSLKQLKNAYYSKTKKSLDTRAYESLRCTKTLTAGQYTRLLVIKNMSKAENFAQNDWNEVVQRKVDSSFNKATIVYELTKYYLVRECTYNRYQHDLIAQKAEIRENFYHRPTILRILEKVRRNPENDTATKVFKW